MYDKSLVYNRKFRGLGRAITKAVLCKGDQVVATARNPESLNDLNKKFPGQIMPLRLDVRDKKQINDAVANAISHFKRIDVLVNNAGTGVIGAAEAYTDEQVSSQLQTNLYGPIELTRAIIPYLRKQRSGRIFQISSVGGRVGNAGLTIYHATKFGLVGFSKAPSKELTPLGIKVTCIEPGGFRTDMSGLSMTYAAFVGGYESNVNQRADYFKSGKFTPMGDPEKAAKVLIDLSVHPQPPIHLLLGSDVLGLIRQTDEVRKAEMEKWAAVTSSTNSTDAVNFLDNQKAGAFIAIKKQGIVNKNHNEMNDNIKDKVIAITGASSGIGKATALLLAEHGAKLVLGARRLELLETIATKINSAGGQTIYIQTDIKNREDLTRLTRKAETHFGKLDVMINNAGIGPISAFDDLRVEDWEEMIDVNIKGTLYGIAAALPLFRKQGFGHFINVISTAGLKIVPQQGVYAATKNAVRTLTEALRQEAGDKLRVTGVSPGFVNTDFAESMTNMETKAQIMALRDKMAISPDAIARAIMFAIEQPADVDVGDIVVRPTAQG